MVGKFRSQILFKIRKSPLVTQFTIEISCKADFWEFLSSDGVIGNYHPQMLFNQVQRIPFEDHAPPLMSEMIQVDSATHCNTLQHTAAHCSTLQHTTTHCNTLQHTATHCNTLQHTQMIIFIAATYVWNDSSRFCNTLQHTPTHSNTLTLQHTTPQNVLQLKCSAYPSKITRRRLCLERCKSTLCVAVCCS